MTLEERGLAGGVEAMELELEEEEEEVSGQSGTGESGD